MTRKRILLAFLLAALCLLSACAPGEGEKGPKNLRQQVDEYLAGALADGKVDEIRGHWTDRHEAGYGLDMSRLSGENGTVKVGTVLNPPFACFENNCYGGISLELLYDFCLQRGYGMEVMDFSTVNSLVMSVAAGKCDVGATAISITEERRKSVEFSIEYFNNPHAVMTNRADADAYPTPESLNGKKVGVLAGSTVYDLATHYFPEAVIMEFNNTPDTYFALFSGKVDAIVQNVVMGYQVLESYPDVVAVQTLQASNPYGFIFPKGLAGSSLAESLRKTFVEGSRWQLILQGIGQTLLISLASIFFGTAVGFALFWLCDRRQIRLLRPIVRFLLALVNGTPAVVFLMIFYYVIFGNSKASGTLVSIIAFSVIFVSVFLAAFRQAAATVDPGQYEVSYALGYSPSQSFFRVILPQILRHLWPDYQSAVIGHIKATSIVGYIAVVDVTKAGDMIRSSTYEAFVPLIVVAIFYFLILWLATGLIRLIQIQTRPSARISRRRLKGVKRHD